MCNVVFGSGFVVNAAGESLRVAVCERGEVRCEGDIF